MSAKAVGNRPAVVIPNGRRGIGGIGAENQLLGIGWCGIVGKSGNLAYLSVQQILSQGLQLGIFAQSTVPVTLDFTLQNPGFACNADPLVQANVTWANTMTLTPSDIVPIEILFACVRVTFGGDGEVYFGAK